MVSCSVFSNLIFVSDIPKICGENLWIRTLSSDILFGRLQIFRWPIRRPISVDVKVMLIKMIVVAVSVAPKSKLKKVQNSKKKIQCNIKTIINTGKKRSRAKTEKMCNIQKQSK